MPQVHRDTNDVDADGGLSMDTLARAVASELPDDGEALSRFHLLRRPWRQENQSALMALATCAVLAASPVTLTPGDGLDRSWLTALNLARPSSLRFGRDILFTYGPWGYLDYPTGTSRQNLVLGSLFALVSVAVAWWAGWRAFRRVISRDRAAWASSAVIVLMIPAGGASAMLLVGAALGLLDMVSRRTGDSSARYPLAASACAALLLQVKFSEGAVLIPMVFVACFAVVKRRLTAIKCALTFVVCTGLFWLLGAQQIGDLPRWFIGSIRISRGYTEAMALETDPNSIGYLMMVLLTVTVALYLLKSAYLTGLFVALKVAVIAALLMYLGLREGFGRHDVGHEAFFYILTVPVLVWFAGSRNTSRLRLFPVFLAVSLGLNGFLHTNPSAVRSRWATELEILTDKRFRNNFVEVSKAEARKRYRLTGDLLSQLQGPVAVDGWEAALPWAYNLRWNPAPVFQSYVAYTHALDLINRDWLIHSGESQAILRPTSTGIDGRNSLWDPPAYVVAEICNFRPAASTEVWLVLKKSSDRCSQPRLIRAESVHANDAIAIPVTGPGELLTMSFSPTDTSVFVTIGRSLNKSFGELSVTADGTRFRLPRALAVGPLAVSVPATVGWPSQFGGTTAYHSLSFSEAGTVRFNIIEVS